MSQNASFWLRIHLYGIFLPQKCDRLVKRTHSTQKQDKRESVEYVKCNNSNIPVHLTNINCVNHLCMGE